MATPTATRVAFSPAKAGVFGHVVADVAWTTYAQNGTDKLDLSGIRIPGVDPTQIVAVQGVAPTGHVVVWTPNASATLADAGGLSLFAGTTQLAAGAYAQTVRLKITYAPGPTLF